MITEAQAAAYAHEVNLVASDLPGATVVAREHDQGRESGTSVELSHCDDGVDPNRAVVNINSATLEIVGREGADSVFSSAVVMPTAALAARSFGALLSPRGHSCVLRMLPAALERSVRANGDHVGRAAVTFLPLPVIDGAKRLRVRVTLTIVERSADGKAVSVPTYIEFYAMLAGPAEVNMTISSIEHPLPTTTERQLLARLAGRAEKYKLS